MSIAPLPRTFSIQTLQAESASAWKDSGIRLGMVISLLLALVTIGLAWFSVTHAPPKIPLHYARPWGQQQLVDRRQLWFLGGSVIPVFGLSVMGSILLYSKDRLLSKVVLYAELLVVFLIAASIATVLGRVGSF